MPIPQKETGTGVHQTSIGTDHQPSDYESFLEKCIFRTQNPFTVGTKQVQNPDKSLDEFYPLVGLYTNVLLNLREAETLKSEL